MGSGLILLVIVGAWLAVLVPMALRSHDSATSLRSTDRFGDAMRVLAKRGAGRDVLMPRRGSTGVVLSRGPVTAGPAASTSGRRGLLARRGRASGKARSAAQRRRRSLLALLAVAAATLVAGLVGPVGWLAVHLAGDLLLLAFVVHLRRQAVLRSGRRRAEGRRAPVMATESSVPAPIRVAGIPDRMPTRPAARSVAAALSAPARRYDEPVPAPAATAAVGSWDGASWSPVPVPPPTYVGKPMAPARRTRVLDLTRPGQWTAAMEGDELDLSVMDDGPELDEILDRRRAVNDW